MDECALLSECPSYMHTSMFPPFQAMCLCLSMAGSSAYTANIISVEQVNGVMDYLLQAHQKNVQVGPLVHCVENV